MGAGVKVFHHAAVWRGYEDLVKLLSPEEPSDRGLEYAVLRPVQ